MNLNDKKTFFRNHIIIYEEDLAKYIWKRVYRESDTADILQSVFLNAWKNLEQLSCVEKSRSWLYAIANNCINEYFRRKIIEDKHLYMDKNDEDDTLGILNDLYVEEDSVLSEIIERFEAELAFEALHFLSPEDRALINMRYIDEICIKNMLETTGLKEKTLSSKLSRALKKYRQIYFDLEQGREVTIKYGKRE